MTGQILLFDDNPVTVKVFVSGVSSAGHSVLNADSVEKTLEVLSSATMDALVVDLDAVDGSGFSCLEAVRARADLADTPIVTVSAHASRDVVQAALALGIVRFLVRPVAVDAMLAEIEGILTRPNRFCLDPEAEVLTRLGVGRDEYQGVLGELRSLATTARAGLEGPGEDGADCWTQTVGAVGRVSAAVGVVATGPFMEFGGDGQHSLEDWRAVALRDLRRLEAQIEERMGADSAPSTSDEAASAPPS